METYLINYKSKIIGVYNNIDKAKLFINSCLSNNLMIGPVEILVYTSNSCYCINKINITLEKENSQIKKDLSPIKSEFIPIKNKKDINYNDPSVIKLAEDKIILQHKINMLKVQKERIEESKEIYNNDIKLYNKFKQNLITDSNFIIPELFIDKYSILKKLDNENRLDWDNFFKEYNHNNIYGDYFKLNSYEESFIATDKKGELNEEFEIASDSETSDTE